jgi:hypothetical protein
LYRSDEFHYLANIRANIWVVGDAWRWFQVPQEQQRQQHQQPVRSRTGTITVATTERGLPTALRIDRSELARPPQELASEILGLCQLSAMRTQIAYRRQLVSKGFTSSVIREIGLPTEEDLADAEEALFGAEEDDEPPATWMRSV